MLKKDPDERMVVEEMRVRNVSALRLYHRCLPDLSCFGLVGTPMGDQKRRGSDAHDRSSALCDLNLAFATRVRVR